MRLGESISCSLSAFCLVLSAGLPVIGVSLLKVLSRELDFRFSGDLVCLRSEVQTVEARLNKRKTQLLYILRMPFELIKLSKMVNIKTPFSFLLLVVLPSCVI